MADGQMLRVIVYDRLDQYVRDIDPAQIVELKSTEEINGEHSLTIKTTQELEKTNRLVIRDGMGIWHEYVVTGIEGEHGGRKVGAVVHTYHAVWSLQYDLSATYIDTQVGLRPGKPSVPAPALTGLQAALSGTERWQVGTITVTNSGSASFYRRSGWEGIKTLTENWGGEVEATIEVGLTGVVGRYVDLLRHVGSEDATRRFDYGGDVSKIKRTTSDEVWPCRIVPLGKSTETEAGGYTRRPTIADANQGIVWLEDASAVPFVRIPNGSGGWEYPTSIIKNDVYSDPAQLKAWALEHIGEYTRPQVTYEADVVQLVKAGMNPHGVALGDNVVVVDRAFGDEGLAIDARVIKIVQSLIDSTDVKLTIGNAKQSLSTALSGLSRDIVRMDEQQTMAAVYQATADYMDALLGRLNDEINATGGWWYMIPGIGTRTYDAEVSDPAVGAEASKVVEVRGGNIRIADSRTAAGEWDFDTVFQSGHILSKLVTAAELIAGHIGSADSGNYWDLDSGEFRMASTAQLGTQTVQQVVDGVASASSAASSAQSTANSASSAAAAAQSTADSASSAAASAQSTADAASSAASSAQSAVNALSTQEAIFDLLTNDGQVQGLFMSGGELYINGTYVKTGILSSQNGNIYWNLNTGDMNLEGSLAMVMGGTATNAHNYAKFGSMVWRGWIGGSRDTSGKTLYGLHMYSSGEQRDGELLIVPNSSPYSTATNAPSAIICQGVLYISANASAVSDNPQITVGGTTNTAITLRSGSSSGYAHRVMINDTNGFVVNVTNDMFRVKATNSTGTSGEVWARSALISSGFKSRLVDTEDYGQRLLYCYEAAKPMFGDVGSGTIGEDGLCYVEIDDILSETMRTDIAYQVFLQKCGRGDLWVAERHPSYFVVEGTPNLEFSWEVKAVQTGFEHTRTESYDSLSWTDDEGLYGLDVEHVVGDANAYISQIEALYETEAL